MGTIIQSYGPIYGEAVNGTVQGRPNGSVYVPLTNTVSWAPQSDTPTGIKYNSGNILLRYNNALCKMDMSALSQDLASNLATFVYSDSALTTQIGTPRQFTAGIFSVAGVFTVGYDSSDPFTPGDTYYAVVKLMNNSTPVAVSSVLELVAE